MGKSVVSLDIGSKKTACLITEVRDKDSIEIIGAGCAPSSGVEGGVVINPERIVDSIRKAVSEAESISGTKIQSVYAGISGKNIETFESHGTVYITNPDKKIRERDIARVIKAAKPKQLPPGRRVIQTDLKQYVIDGQEGISNPVGMIGNRLEVYQHVITGSMTAVLNLTRAIEKSGIEVEQIFLNSLATSWAVLSRQERKQGVAVLDIGGGITDLTVFKHGRPLFSTCLPIAGGAITRDLAVSLAVPFEEAERIKIKAGIPDEERTNRKERIELTTVGGERKKLYRTQLSEIIGPRLNELFEFALTKIEEESHLDHLTLGVVVTGGVTRIEGLTGYLQEKYDIPVRQGKISTHIQGLSDIVESPEYAVAIGLIIFALKSKMSKWEKRKGFSSGRLLREPFKWFKDH